MMCLTLTTTTSPTVQLVKLMPPLVNFFEFLSLGHMPKLLYCTKARFFYLLLECLFVANQINFNPLVILRIIFYYSLSQIPNHFIKQLIFQVNPLPVTKTDL